MKKPKDSSHLMFSLLNQMLLLYVQIFKVWGLEFIFTELSLMFVIVWTKQTPITNCTIFLFGIQFAVSCQALTAEFIFAEAYKCNYLSEKQKTLIILSHYMFVLPTRLICIVSSFYFPMKECKKRQKLYQIDLLRLA